MGFFDTSGNDADVYSGTTNNAAADYSRLSANDPGQFSSNGIFDRLFGDKNKKEVQQAALETSAGMPSVPNPIAPPEVNPPSPAPKTPTNPSALDPATFPSTSSIDHTLSSGSGLVKTVLSQLNGPPTHNSDGQPLVPGTSMTMPQWMDKLQKTLAPPMQAQPPAQSPYGNQKFGGQQHGGGHFGGATFGGNTFGASAPGTAPPPAVQQPGGQPQGAPQGGPGIPIMQQPLQNPRPSALPNGMGMGAPVTNGYFRGGALRLMRGGYPQLEMGMPQRHAHQGPVSGDGRGDGRSDHVDAKLSPGEFVMDAETVSLLGNGDSDAGARELEHMRQNIRKQKGKALAKGKFSPDAKAPGAYFKGRS